MSDLDEFFDLVGKKVKSMFSLSPEEKQEIKRRYLKANPNPSMMGITDMAELGDTLREMYYMPSAEYAMSIFKDKESEEFKKLCILYKAKDDLFWELFPNGRGQRTHQRENK